MVGFTYYNPVRIIFGIGEMKKIGETTSVFGKNALVVSYSDVSTMQSVIDLVLKALQENRVKVTTCFNVTANPMLSQVNEGIQL